MVQWSVGFSESPPLAAGAGSQNERIPAQRSDIIIFVYRDWGKAPLLLACSTQLLWTHTRQVIQKKNSHSCILKAACILTVPVTVNLVYVEFFSPPSFIFSLFQDPSWTCRRTDPEKTARMRGRAMDNNSESSSLGLLLLIVVRAAIRIYIKLN